MLVLHDIEKRVREVQGHYQVGCSWGAFAPEVFEKDDIVPTGLEKN